jgi:hypothetical protein
MLGILGFNSLSESGFSGFEDFQDLVLCWGFWDLLI